MSATPQDDWWMHAPKVGIPMMPVDAITGADKGLCTAWEGDVLPLDGSEPLHCVFKQVRQPGMLPVEMACALVGAMLGNKVPRPCLVRVTPDLLPELNPSCFTGPTALLFGSTYVANGGFFEPLAHADDATLDSAVWNHFCSDATIAAKGAALDELLANWDRHYRNMRFDGRHWWLIDHDNALTPTVGADLGTLDATFRAHQNQIADQLRTRRPQDHDMPKAARLSSERLEKVQALAARAALWADADPQVHALWQQTAPLITLLSRRLPMLQNLINARIGVDEKPALSWTPTPEQPTPPTS